MPAIRGYMAASLDGYIADPDGGYGFLDRYESVDYGFAGFMAEIGTCVFGRTTYDQSIAMSGPEWPFRGKRAIVVSSRPLGERPANVEHWREGVGPALVAHLRAAEGGDVWIVGGGRLQGALFDLDAIDRLQAWITPDLLGDGIPMWPKSSRRHRLELTDMRRLPIGLAMLDYRRG